MAATPGVHQFMAADTLDMLRLLCLRDKFELNVKVFFRQSRLDGSLDTNYLFWVVEFLFCEPWVHFYYRLR